MKAPTTQAASTAELRQCAPPARVVTACGLSWAALPPCNQGFQTHQPLLKFFILLLQIFDLFLLGLDHVLLRGNYRVLLLDFVQQHGREVLIPHRVGLAVVIVGHKLGVDLGYFLRDQSILQEVRSPLSYSGL